MNQHSHMGEKCLIGNDAPGHASGGCLLASGPQRMLLITASHPCPVSTAVRRGKVLVNDFFSMYFLSPYRMLGTKAEH